jgi:hypothetical protein
MKQERRNVFETNSSSTHSITMCMESEYDAWKAGKLYYDKEDEKFLTKAEVISLFGEEPEYQAHMLSIPEEEFVEKIQDSDIYDYDGYWESSSYLEGYTDSYTTPSGEHVVAFGMYGYD